MKPSLSLALIVIALAAVAHGGTIAGFKDHNEVQSVTVVAMTEWVNKADDATGCGGGDCCPNATAAACLRYAETIRPQLALFSDDVASYFQFDNNFSCNTWVQPSGQFQTVCTKMHAEMITPVSQILSTMAGKRFPNL
jgi:hypothetical protein